MADRATLESALGWWNTIGLVCCVVAALGAAGLAVVAYMQRQIGNELKPILDAEQRAHDKAIADARAEAEQAKARAAEANEKAEAERLARMKIEERLAPRSLDVVSVISALGREFAGESVLIDASDDPEPSALANAIDSALSAAGLLCNEQYVQGPDVSIGGVRVTYLKKTTERQRKAASAIADALRRGGLSVSGPEAADRAFVSFFTGVQHRAQWDQTIRIIVGHK